MYANCTVMCMKMWGIQKISVRILYRIIFNMGYKVFYFIWSAMLISIGIVLRTILIQIWLVIWKKVCRFVICFLGFCCKNGYKYSYHFLICYRGISSLYAPVCYLYKLSYTFFSLKYLLLVILNRSLSSSGKYIIIWCLISLSRSKKLLKLNYKFKDSLKNDINIFVYFYFYF